MDGFVEPLGMRVLICKDEDRHTTRGGIVLRRKRGQSTPRGQSTRKTGFFGRFGSAAGECFPICSRHVAVHVFNSSCGT